MYIIWCKADSMSVAKWFGDVWRGMKRWFELKQSSSMWWQDPGTWRSEKGVTEHARTKDHANFHAKRSITGVWKGMPICQFAEYQTDVLWFLVMLDERNLTCNFLLMERESPVNQDTQNVFCFPLFEHAKGDMFEVTRTVVSSHTCGEMNIYRTS